MANDYPRMMYHEEGHNQIVNSEQEENDLASGWSRDASDKHFAWQSNVPNHFRTRVPINDPNKGPDTSGEDLAARIAQLERLLMEAGQRRPPGRPPGSTNRNPEGE